MSGEFDLFIGIDYSGARTPTCRLKGLQVYAAKPGGQPERQFLPAPSNNNMPCNWTRAEIAGRLIDLARQGVRYVAGIDHGFSFPVGYFERYGLKSWPQFLDDFILYWPPTSGSPPTIVPASSRSAATSSAPRSPRTASSSGPTGASSSR